MTLFQHLMTSLAVCAGLLLGASAHAVGFQRISVADGGAAPLEVGVWYPSDAQAAPVAMGPFEMTIAIGAPVAGGSLPLIVISHGSGGTYLGHFDTAIALAQAGYVVAAVMHRGDNYADDSRAVHIMDRPKHIHRVLDHLLGAWPASVKLDANRVGMFGFSAGGFTTLVMIGGTPDLAKVTPHCREHASEFTCQLVARHATGVTQPEPVSKAGSAMASGQPASLKDPRIKAAVVAAPALGFSFAPNGLGEVTVPVDLWRAEDDRVLPFPSYAEAVRLALPGPPSMHEVPKAGHFDFLAPCSDALKAIAGEICQSAEGFDRAAFHRQFNASVVGFFNARLKR